MRPGQTLNLQLTLENPRLCFRVNLGQTLHIFRQAYGCVRRVVGPNTDMDVRKDKLEPTKISAKHDLPKTPG